MNRREFLETAVVFAVATKVAAAVSPRKEAPLVNESYIMLPKERTVLELEGGESVEVTIHSEGFDEGLRYIAQREDPEDGLRKLHDFIKRNGPLRIEIAESDLRNGDGAKYLLASWGGPEFEYSPHQLEDYYKKEVDGNMTKILVADTLHYHELFHVWQDILNPVKTNWGAFKSELGMDHKEVWKKANDILLEKIGEGDFSEEGHLGKFFSFSRVR